MTEKLFTGTLNHNQNKKKQKNKKIIAHIAKHADILKLLQEFSVYSIKFVQHMVSLSF